MKCDELKAETIVPQGCTITLQMYPKAEVDAAIAELKKKLMPCLNGDCILPLIVVEKYGKENAELKKKLEDVQASHYAESVDAGMRERRLNRELWIARAKRALEKIAWFKLWNCSISTMNPEDSTRQEYDKWKKNLGKLLKKAEAYR